MRGEAAAPCPLSGGLLVPQGLSPSRLLLIDFGSGLRWAWLLSLMFCHAVPRVRTPLLYGRVTFWRKDGPPFAYPSSVMVTGAIAMS